MSNPVMNKVRWGILSTAKINESIIPAIRCAHNCTLVAIASRNEERAKFYAKRWKIPQSFGDYESLISSDLIDAVYISLPNHLHSTWSIKAMQKGKHVLCEKPLSLSSVEIEKIINTSRINKKVITEALMYLHHPQTNIIKNSINEGLIGAVLLIRSEFCFLLGDSYNIRLDPQCGGGALRDLGVYPISFAQFIIGERPTAVYGYNWFRNTGVDDTFAGTLKYDKGAIVQFMVSFSMPFSSKTEIIGSDGKLIIQYPYVNIPGSETGICKNLMNSIKRNIRLLLPYSCHLWEEHGIVFIPKSGKQRTINIPSAPLYKWEIENMNQAIIKGTPTLISLNESRDHIRTIEALYESAKQHLPVTMN